MTAIYFVETTTGEQNDCLCRWTERFYLERKRVRVVVDSMADAQRIDQLLWTFSQQSFIPHEIFNSGANQPGEPVVITPGPFPTAGCEVVVCGCETELEFMSFFETAIHFIVGDDPQRKQKSRLLWQRARDLGLNPKHVPYEGKR
ncbi:MAG: DNA polymerase III subunit chi [Syntrophobacteraceae bacterium]